MMVLIRKAGVYDIYGWPRGRVRKLPFGTSYMTSEKRRGLKTERKLTHNLGNDVDGDDGDDGGDGGDGGRKI